MVCFSGRVNIVFSEVLEKFLKARFFETQGTVSSGRPESNPDDIDHIKVVFWDSENDADIIDSIGFAEFGEP